MRIVRACAELGLRSVAIYTEPDRLALRKKRADGLIRLVPTRWRVISTLIVLSIWRWRWAAMPFTPATVLSENKDFAKTCEKRALFLLGPGIEVIHKMGDKTQARDAMRAAGVPITPGSKGNLADVKQKP